MKPLLTAVYFVCALVACGAASDEPPINEEEAQCLSGYGKECERRQIDDLARRAEDRARVEHRKEVDSFKVQFDLKHSKCDSLNQCLDELEQRRVDGQADPGPSHARLSPQKRPR